MGNIIEYVLKHKKRVFQVIIVIIILIVLLFFAAAQYVITLDEGIENDGNPKNTPAVVSKHIDESALNTLFENEDGSKDLKTKTSKNGGYALDIDLDKITDEIIEDIKKHGGTLDVYFSGGNLHEYLKKMIKAEYITQYPDLRKVDEIGTEVSSEEFQGVIKFIRHNSDGSAKTLQYIPLGDKEAVNGNTLYGLINQANGKGGVSSDTIQNARNVILNYFSIDISGNLIIAKWTETVTKSISGSYETGYKSDSEEADYSEIDRPNIDSAPTTTIYEYSPHIINYKSSVSKYTMPFNYLWAYMVCGRDEEFINDFVDLVLDSQIEISIYDNLTEIETESINAYNSNRWESERITKRTIVDGREERRDEGKWSEQEVTNTTHNYQIDYMKTYTNTVVVAPTYVDIWYMKYLANYAYEIVDSGEEKDISRASGEDLGEPQFEEGDWVTTGTRREPKYNTQSNNTQGNNTTITEYTVTEEQEKKDLNIQYKSNQCTLTSYYHTIQYNYTLEGDPQVEEKTNPKLQEGEEGYPNFCTLYLKSQAARGNIDRNEAWLFEIIEKNVDTVNMLELTKYMFYCATNRNFGVTSFSFESLYPTSLVVGLYGGSVEEQVWFALLDAGYTKESAAGVLGNLQQESGIRTNNLQNSYETSLNMNDEAYTQAVDSGTYTSFTSDSAGYGLAQWTSSGRKKGLYSFAQSRGVSISDASMQIEYLIGEISPSGGADGYASFQMGSGRNGYSYSSWTNASTPEEAAVAFCDVFERPGDPNYNARRRYAREFYDKFVNLSKDSLLMGVIPLTGENQEKMTNMLNEAIRIANDDRYGYSQSRRNQEFFYDCSSLVCRLYQEFFGITVPSTTAQYPSYNSFNKGNASSVELQPGDVLWRRNGDQGHVTIYIGNGNYVAAHTDKTAKSEQITVYQDNPANYTYVYRFIGT